MDPVGSNAGRKQELVLMHWRRDYLQESRYSNYGDLNPNVDLLFSEV